MSARSVLVARWTARSFLARWTARSFLVARWTARSLTLGLVMVLAACGPSRRAWQPVESDGASMPSAFAVVAAAVPLSIAPRADAERITPHVTRDAYGLPTGPVTFTSFRILGEEDGWARLETLGEPAGAHCADGLPELAPFRLRVFVPSAALALVTQREVTQRFDDQTSIELARGVPLEPLPSVGWFRVHIGNLTTIVRLAQPELGTRYLPSAEAPPLAPPARVLPAAALAAGAPILGRTGRVDSSAGRDVPIVGERAGGSETWVELRPPCARLLLRVPSHAIVSAAEEGMPVDPALPAPGGLVVRAGAAVRWRDGSAAGTVTRDAPLGAEVEPAGGLRCFDPCRGAGCASAVLCFDPRDLAGAGGGLGGTLDDPRTPQP